MMAGPLGAGADMIKYIAIIILLAGCNEGGLTLEQKVRRQEEDLLRSVGRYQYVPNTGGYFNHGRLVDTATGRIWMDRCWRKDAKTGDCLKSAWSEEDVVGLSTTTLAFYEYLDKYYPEKTAKK